MLLGEKFERLSRFGRTAFSPKNGAMALIGHTLAVSTDTCLGMRVLKKY